MIYLLRHGLDDERYVGGWSDADLIPEGIEQVKSAVDFLKTNQIILEEIVSSDIKRAVETSKIISEYLDLDITLTPALRELNKGKFNGQKLSVIKQKIMPFNDSLDINTKYPDGESMMDLYNRIKSYLEIFKKMNNVLIVTHRGVINMLYFILNDLEPNMNKTQFDVTHGSIHECDVIQRHIKKIY